MKEMQENSRLISALSSEPDFKLKTDFVESVIKRIQLAEMRKIRISWWRQTILASLFGFIGLILLLIFGGASMIQLISSAWPWILIGGLLLLAFQYLDQRLMHKRDRITYTFSGNRQ